MELRVGLVGYGVGGRRFHAPYILASPGCELVGVVTRSAERAAEAAADAPGVAVHDSLGALLAAGVDAVVISTPPETRQQLVREALARGVHVVADKPFAPTAADGETLVAAAEDARRLLNVFHDSRWDADIVIARQVVAGGELGSIQRPDLRLDADDSATVEAGPGGGLRRDLGTHVVDPALHLLGPANAVSAHLDHQEVAGEPTDVGFVLTVCDRLFLGRLSGSFRPSQWLVSCRKSAKNPATGVSHRRRRDGTSEESRSKDC